MWSRSKTFEYDTEMEMITETKTMSPGAESAPATPDWMAPLSRELESVIAKRNLLTCRTRRKVLDDLHEAATKEEVTRAHYLHMLYQYKLNNVEGLNGFKTICLVPREIY